MLMLDSDPSFSAAALYQMSIATVASGLLAR
jgi:hypothetical protein